MSRKYNDLFFILGGSVLFTALEQEHEELIKTSELFFLVAKVLFEPVLY